MPVHSRLIVFWVKGQPLHKAVKLVNFSSINVIVLAITFAPSEYHNTKINGTKAEV